MKMYVGYRVPDGPTRVWRLEDGLVYELNPRHDLWNHSPDGFQWGYGGSGPAQLALAVLADATGESALAIRLHQNFKFSMLAGLRSDSWTLTAEEVLYWVAGACACLIDDVVDFRLPEKGGSNGAQGTGR